MVSVLVMDRNPHSHRWSGAETWVEVLGFRAEFFLTEVALLADDCEPEELAQFP